MKKQLLFDILILCSIMLCEVYAEAQPQSESAASAYITVTGSSTAYLLEKEELLSQIEDIFVEEGVPAKYVCIAKVESNFDPEAVSSAGAAGIFQLMPDTARRFGLKVEEDIDERFDPLKSARAAARYLSFLKNYFNNWLLAIAAYNAGEGRVSKALQSVDTNTDDLKTILALLPEETQNYVPKVLAALEMSSSKENIY